MHAFQHRFICNHHLFRDGKQISSRQPTTSLKFVPSHATLISAIRRYCPWFNIKILIPLHLDLLALFTYLWLNSIGVRGGKSMYRNAPKHF